MQAGLFHPATEIISQLPPFAICFVSDAHKSLFGNRQQELNKSLTSTFYSAQRKSPSAATFSTGYLINS